MVVLVFCRGHGATREAAQGAEIRPAAEVSRASPRWVGGPADNLRGRAEPGLSERVARSGLLQASRRTGPCVAREPALGTPAWSRGCSSRAVLLSSVGCTLSTRCVQFEVRGRSVSRFTRAAVGPISLLPGA